MNTEKSQEKITIAAGQNVLNTLVPATRQQLTQAYFKMYFGLSWVNWLKQRKSLGMAWQTALSQIDAFVRTKQLNSPAAQYLSQINAKHKKQWPMHIMTNDNRDKRLNCPADKITEWYKYGQGQIDAAMATIGLIMTQHQVNVTQNATTNALPKNITDTAATMRNIEQLHINRVFVEQQHITQREVEGPARTQPRRAPTAVLHPDMRQPQVTARAQQSTIPQRGKQRISREIQAAQQAASGAISIHPAAIQRAPQTNIPIAKPRHAIHQPMVRPARQAPAHTPIRQPKPAPVTRPPLARTIVATRPLMARDRTIQHKSPKALPPANKSAAFINAQSKMREIQMLLLLARRNQKVA